MARSAFVGSLGVLLAFAFPVATDVTFTMTLALAVSVTLRWVFFRERRTAIRAVIGPLLLAYVLAGVLVSPILWYALTDFGPGAVNTVGSFPGDVADLVIPTGLIALSGSKLNSIAERFLGNTAEKDLYLGIPTIVIAVWLLATRRRTAGARLLASTLALAVIASFGASLYFEGRRVAPSPWALVHRLPAFDNVIASRLAVYTTLLAAVIVALWAAAERPSAWVRAVLTGFALVVLVPSMFTRTPWKLHPGVPGFFAAGGWTRTCLRPGDNLLVLPFLSDALLWQTQNGYRFRLAAPHVASSAPAPFEHDGVVQAITHSTSSPGGGRALVRRARSLGVSEIVVEAARPERWRTLLARTARPAGVGGVLLYRISGTRPPGCPGQ